MRVLVTGAAGFIGSHLCQRLIADGHEVVGLDDLSVGSLENIADLPEIRFSDTDLLDAESVRIAAAGCDATLHHAARKSVPRSIRQPEAFVDVNVEERRTSCWLAATNAPSSFPHLPRCTAIRRRFRSTRSWSRVHALRPPPRRSPEKP